MSPSNTEQRTARVGCWFSIMRAIALLLLLTIWVATISGGTKVGDQMPDDTIRLSPPISPRVPQTQPRAPPVRRLWWAPWTWFAKKGKSFSSPSSSPVVNNEHQRTLLLPFVSRMLSSDEKYIYVDRGADRRDQAFRRRQEQQKKQRQPKQNQKEQQQRKEKYPQLVFNDDDDELETFDSAATEMTAASPLLASNAGHSQHVCSLRIYCAEQQKAQSRQSMTTTTDGKSPIVMSFDLDDRDGWLSRVEEQLRQNAAKIVTDALDSAALADGEVGGDARAKAKQRPVEPRFTVDARTQSSRLESMNQRYLQAGSLVRMQLCEFLPNELVEFNLRRQEENEKNDDDDDGSVSMARPTGSSSSSSSSSDSDSQSNSSSSKQNSKSSKKQKLRLKLKIQRELAGLRQLRKLWLFTGKEEIRFQLYRHSIIDAMERFQLDRQPLPSYRHYAALELENDPRVPVAELGVLPGQSAVETRFINFPHSPHLQLGTVEMPHDPVYIKVPLPRLPARLVRQRTRESGGDGGYQYKVCYSMTAQVPATIVIPDGDSQLVFGVRIGSKLLLSPLGFGLQILEKETEKEEGKDRGDSAHPSAKQPVDTAVSSQSGYMTAWTSGDGGGSGSWQQFSSGGGSSGGFSHLPPHASPQRLGRVSSAPTMAFNGSPFRPSNNNNNNNNNNNGYDYDDDDDIVSGASDSTLLGGSSSPSTTVTSTGNSAGTPQTKIDPNNLLLLSIRDIKSDQWYARSRQEFTLNIAIRPLDESHHRRLADDEEDTASSSAPITRGSSAIPRVSSSNSVKSSATFRFDSAAGGSTDWILLQVSTDYGRELGLTRFQFNFKTKTIYGPITSAESQHNCMNFRFLQRSDWAGFSFAKDEDGSDILLIKLRVTTDVYPEPQRLLSVHANYISTTHGVSVESVRKDVRVHFHPHNLDNWAGITFQLTQSLIDDQPSIPIDKKSVSITLVDPQEIRLDVRTDLLQGLFPCPMCAAQTVIGTVRLIRFPSSSSSSSSPKELWAVRLPFHQVDATRIGTLVTVSKNVMFGSSRNFHDTNYGRSNTAATGFSLSIHVLEMEIDILTLEPQVVNRLLQDGQRLIFRSPRFLLPRTSTGGKQKQSQSQRRPSSSTKQRNK